MDRSNLNYVVKARQRMDWYILEAEAGKELTVCCVDEGIERPVDLKYLNRNHR